MAVKEFTGDVRRAYRIAELAPDLDLLVGADDVLLELGAGRRRRLDRRLPERDPAGVRGALQAPPSPRDLDDQRCRSTATCTRCSAGTRETEFVQAIKLSMDIVGRQGGACRPPRVPLLPERPRQITADTERRRGHWRTGPATGAARHAHHARLPRRRLPHRGHADPGHHRRGRRDPRRRPMPSACTSWSTWTASARSSCTSRAAMPP